ncbi:hypothetical protein ACTHGU_16490 [Chitinophagaceae bacterium MMS25-I14]
MKKVFTLPLFLLSTAAQSQTLRPADFYKCYDFSNKTDHGFLKKKGFDMISDSVQRKAGVFCYRKTSTNEVAEVTYNLVYEANGGYAVWINYYLPQIKQYNALITSLKTSKFRYSKRHKVYESPFESSYSGQTIAPGGPVKFHNVQYYLVVFTATIGKELFQVLPRPGEMQLPGQ